VRQVDRVDGVDRGLMYELRSAKAEKKFLE